MIYLGLVVFFMGNSILAHYNGRQELIAKQQKVAAESEQLKQQYTDLFRQRDEYLAIRQGLLEQATYVQMLNRISWSEVLSVVAEDIPEQLSLTKFRFAEGGTVTFEGESLQIETVAELIRRVEHSEFLMEGKFDFLREATVEEQKIFVYGIFSSLKTNLGKEPQKSDESAKQSKPTAAPKPDGT